MTTPSFTLTLDTAPPADPSLLINGGAASTGQALVLAEVDTSDYQSGAQDVATMLLWGDVDPTADPSVQVAEGDSTWQAYSQLTTVTLDSSVAGLKQINLRLRDDVCNETLTVCAQIRFDPTLPYVTVTSPVARSKISKVAGYDTATFSWISSVDYTDYVIRVVPGLGSPVTTGIPIPSTAGSVHVGGAPGTADVAVTTTVHGADLQTASPGDTVKTLKIFVKNASGVWSP